jgi:hypothetical protein
MQIHVVDPESGEIVYHGMLQPHVAFQDLSDATLETLWRDLLTADEDGADKLAWHMATGQDKTVRFLAERFRPERTYKPDEVRKRIAELDSDQFAKRQEAFEALRSMGSVVRGEVEQAVAQQTSAEVRSRLRRLLASWNEGVSADPEIRRELRSVLVLKRIGTKSAVGLLEQLARGDRESLRARAARKALEKGAAVAEPKPGNSH